MMSSQMVINNRRAVASTIVLLLAIAMTVSISSASTAQPRLSSTAHSRGASCPSMLTDSDSIARAAHAISNVCSKEPAMGEDTCSGSCIKRIVNVLVFGADIDKLVDVADQSGDYINSNLAVQGFERSASDSQRREAVEVDMVDHCVIDPYVHLLIEAQAIHPKTAELLHGCANEVTELIRNAMEAKFETAGTGLARRTCGCSPIAGQDYACTRPTGTQCSAQNTCTGGNCVCSEAGQCGALCTASSDCGDNGSCIGDPESCICNVGFTGSNCQLKAVGTSFQAGFGLSC